MSILTSLLELDALAVAQAKEYRETRFIFDNIALTTEERVFKGIVGPRGVGKTVLLKQLRAREERAIYLSCDTLEPDHDLFETVKTFQEKLKLRWLFLDEVHFLKAYDQLLKKIYDFLEVRLVFTSSVALAMHESAYDLARRVRLYTLLPFSFREFLFFSKKIKLAPLALGTVFSGKYSPDYLRHAHFFDGYLQGGLYPFCLNVIDPLPLFENILEKIIEKDVATTANLAPSEQQLLRKLVRFVASSPVDGINVSSIAKNLGITKYKSERYVQLLEKAFILQTIFPTGTNVLKEPKILMHPPYRLLFRTYEESVGALREEFFVESMHRLGQTIFYLKTKRGEKTPDYWTKVQGEPVIIEIGGGSKGRTQFKGTTASWVLVLGDKMVPHHHQQPLFLVGFADSATTE